VARQVRPIAVQPPDVSGEWTRQLGDLLLEEHGAILPEIVDRVNRNLAVAVEPPRTFKPFAALLLGTKDQITLESVADVADRMPASVRPPPRVCSPGQ
jgi:hypothetical protein